VKKAKTHTHEKLAVMGKIFMRVRRELEKKKRGKKKKRREKERRRERERRREGERERGKRKKKKRRGVLPCSLLPNILSIHKCFQTLF